VDALYSTVNMPGGVPVATVSIGEAGARNAALLACRIMALSNPGLSRKLADYREEMARAVEESDRNIKNKD
jgi:5-(carboxyamino)imidazole ribonucleotide mutase